jgi:anti-anti-sigma regulatory factor
MRTATAPARPGSAPKRVSVGVKKARAPFIPCGVDEPELTVIAEIGRYHGTFVFDFTDVALIDTMATKTLASFVHKLRRAHTRVFIAGTRSGVRRTLLASGCTTRRFFARALSPTPARLCKLHGP